MDLQSSITTRNTSMLSTPHIQTVTKSTYFKQYVMEIFIQT
jgi:hypothetical protein